MPRGYRSYVLAAVGWLILAASPPQQQRSEPQRQSEQAVADSLNRIAGALERDDEPEGYTANCEQARDNRRSDLCAQWKAADAASQAAGWAGWTWWLGLGGIIIGLGTLGAAGAAAYFAKKAADHTKRGADAAEKAIAHSQAQSRASFISIRDGVEWDPETRALTILFDIQNIGATPAYGVTITTDCWIGKGRNETRYGEENRTVLETIGRNGEINLPETVFLSAKDAGRLQRRTSLMIEYYVAFTDEFGDQWAYDHLLSVNKAGLLSGDVFTERCHHIRIDPPEAKPANHELPLAGRDPDQAEPCCTPNDGVRLPPRWRA